MLLLDSFFQLVANQFLHTSPSEWIGVITGFACIYLATRESVWSWPVSIISVLAYAWVFYEAKMYGDMSLQFYFLFTAIYGWYYWMKKKESDDKPITDLDLRGRITAVLAVIILTVLLGVFLANFTDTDVPFADGFCTAMSFVAQVLLTRKVLYNWILWIIVDICYVPLYIYKNLNLSAVFYTVLIALAIKGYLDWKKNYREQAN
ncbi:nicotinamide riboside transporter PnuC [Pedobacter sp. GR22-6]|uniref:nicotinamide riboside transporter PnuC n=1 Tax=Pedobacter sp. GR22-6 TaxID=3127957 RepID=UPI00307EA35E